MIEAASLRAAEKIWAGLLEGNRRFRTNQPQPRNLVEERVAVASRRNPKAVILACADSRVAPEIVFDQKLGDLFVVRGAGNTADASDLGSIEFAVQELGVQLLVVVGHTHCAAIAIACAGSKVESANLKTMVKRLRPACQLAGGNGEDHLRAAERANITLVARDIVERSLVLHDGIQRGTLTVVGACYDVATGEIVRVK